MNKPVKPRECVAINNPKFISVIERDIQINTVMIIKLIIWFQIVIREMQGSYTHFYRFLQYNHVIVLNTFIDIWIDFSVYTYNRI